MGRVDCWCRIQILLIVAFQRPRSKTHIRELLEEPGLPDDLQIEQENNKVTTMTSQWEIYSNTYTSDTTQAEIDDCIPTGVHIAHERHRELFMKYKHVFRRTVRPEPAAVPPMTLQIQENEWRVKRNRLPPRFQTNTKADQLRWLRAFSVIFELRALI